MCRARDKYYAFVYGRTFKGRTIAEVHEKVTRYEREHLELRAQSCQIWDL